MTRPALLLVCACAALSAADIDVGPVLKGVEERYNRTRTLQVPFQETYRVGGRGRRQESGTLSLRKPGRMRWEYSNPAGKLFLSDGKDVILYLPSTNKAEKMRLKESEDMRAPLAFLLGKLDFKRDFLSFDAKEEAGAVRVKAFPNSDRLPYKQVEFWVTPDRQIRRLLVLGQDQSELEFVFGDEVRNPKLEDGLFRFVLPVGASWVEAGD